MKSFIRTFASFRQKRRLCALLIALTLTAVNHGATPISAGSVSTEATVVLDTANATPLPGSFRLLNGEPGNQSWPHVDCDVATYSYDDFEGSSTIHYQNVSAGFDNVIPGNEVDVLSDISGSRIAYTEVTFSGETVRIYDINSLTTTIVPGFGLSKPSIGGTLVAFEDIGSVVEPGARDVSTYDLSTGTVTKLTNDNDTLENFDPDVSPTGDAVVWAQCADGVVGCDIYAATRTSTGVFTKKALTTGRHESRSETSTDGNIAVYVSDRTGERDIYYQPLTGGTEVHLAIPGDQYVPSISGGLISFASTHLNGYDVFVYDTRTGRLYEVTTGVSAALLNDISVCGDTGRVVYATAGDGFDLFAFTFQVPSVPSNTEDQLNDLIALIRSFNLPPGIANSLVRKLQNALDAVNASDTATACSSLTAFIKECQAQSGKKLTPEQSTQLITAANHIKTDLGCP
jgi:hypothetical protein